MQCNALRTADYELLAEAAQQSEDEDDGGSDAGGDDGGDGEGGGGGRAKRQKSHAGASPSGAVASARERLRIVNVSGDSGVCAA